MNYAYVHANTSVSVVGRRVYLRAHASADVIVESLSTHLFPDMG